MTSNFKIRREEKNWPYRKKSILILHLVCILSCSLFGKDARIDSLKQVLTFTKSDSSRYVLNKEIGEAYYEVDFDSTLVYYRQALAIAKRLDNIRPQASILRSFAYLYRYKQGDYPKAAFYFNKTLDLAIAKNDTLIRAYILNDLGELYRLKGEKEKAIDFLFQANKRAEELQHKHLLIRTWHGLGDLYAEIQDFEKALVFFKKALPLSEYYKDIRMCGIIFNSIGEVYQNQQQFCFAKDFFNKAIEKYRVLDDNDLQSDAYYNLGNIATRQDSAKVAIDYFDKALKLNKLVTNKNRTIKILTGLGTVYLQIKSYKKAIKFGRKALRELNTIDTKLYYPQINKLLSNSYAALGDHAKAYHYQKAYMIAKDSLQIQSSAKKLMNMTQLYEEEKKNKEIAKLKAQEQLHLAELRLNGQLFILLIVLLLVLFALWQLYQKNNHLNQYRSLRVRLMQDLHDNLSSSLNHIKILANRFGKYKNATERSQLDSQKIKSISNKVVINMHDLVWSLDDTQERLEDLVNRMGDYASSILIDGGINYQIKADITQEDKLLKTTVKNNIYLIYKEAINNILKHSQPEKVEILLSYDKRIFTMKIKNDLSIVKTNTISSGVGMRSIQQRAKEILAKIIIEKEDNYFLLSLIVSL